MEPRVDQRPAHHPEAGLGGTHPHVPHGAVVVESPDRADPIRDLVAEQPADALLEVVVAGGEDDQVGLDGASVGEAESFGFEPVEVTGVAQGDLSVGDQVGAADVDVVAAALA